MNQLIVIVLQVTIVKIIIDWLIFKLSVLTQANLFQIICCCIFAANEATSEETVSYGILGGLGGVFIIIIMIIVTLVISRRKSNQGIN